jgi:arylsulfatase A-like enzyme
MPTARITRRDFVRDAVTTTAGTALAGTAIGAQPRIAAAAEKRRPNILLLYADQHNARVLGCTGHPDVKPTGRKVAISENMVQITAVGERYKLGLWIKRFEPDYPDMLFDREKDPLELNNLIGRPEVAAVEKELRREIAAWIARTPNATGMLLQPAT